MTTDDRSPEPVHGPLVVLVHGAWHGAWSWAPLQASLDRSGIPSIAVDLPGHGASLAPLGGLGADVAHVRSVLDRLGARGHDPFLLVGHSYGGAVISGAAAGRDDVDRLVYVAAFALEAGESVLGAIGSWPRHEVALGPAIVESDTDGVAATVLDPTAAPQALYGSCDELTVAAAISRLGPQSVLSMVEELEASAVGTIPSTYVQCSRDQAVHPVHQDIMAERCTDRVVLDTDHSPQLSRIDEMTELLTGLVGTPAGGGR